ncbi:MAG: HAD-IIA family hydrolase, partial [Candidatus Methanomethylicaceae archaeon]
EAIEFFRSMGIKILFLTNNSTKTPEEYVEKLNKLGISANPSEIMTSTIATAIYMKRFKRDKCYIIGERALKEAICKEGFEITDDGNLAKYVICGLDREFNYKKLVEACKAIQKGAKFIATNTDPRLPIENGYLPGAGAIVNAIKIATGIKPLVIGKPSKFIINLAIKKLGIDKSNVAIIGDRIDTDIKAGKLAGIFTILIEKNKYIEGKIKPDLIISKLKDLVDYFERK